MLGVVLNSFSPLFRRQRPHIFEDNLVYIVSSNTARVTQREPVSTAAITKQNKENKTPQDYVYTVSDCVLFYSKYHRVKGECISVPRTLCFTGRWWCTPLISAPQRQRASWVSGFQVVQDSQGWSIVKPCLKAPKINIFKTLRKTLWVL